jgi:tetratricopeptide (TPR) repeat protein
MKHIFLLIILFFTLQIHSQTSYTDSLKGIYFSNQKDTLRWKAINKLVVYYMNSNIDSAKRYTAIIYNESLKSNSLRLRIRAYFCLGEIEAKNNNYAKQIQFLSKALVMSETAKEYEGVTRSNMRLADVYVKINDLSKAKLYCEKSIKFLLPQSEKIKKEVLSRTYNVLGEIYLKQKNFPKALTYFLPANKRAVNEQLIGPYVSLTYENLARTYEGLNNYKLALKNYNEALANNLFINNIVGLTSCKEGIAGLLLKENKLDSALINTAKSEQLAIKLKNRSALLNAYTQYINIYHQQRDFEKENKYFALKYNLNDSINAIAFGKSLANAKIKFETEEKERENILLQEKTKTQLLQIQNSRNQIILLLIVIVFIACVSLFWLRFNKLKGKQKNTELKQKLLRSQMNPHFIFNALVAIQSFIYSNDAKRAGNFLSDFARLMRLILENSNEEYITLSKEIDTLKYYLELQKLRNSDTFDYTIEVDENIDEETTLIPPMLAQPFIENSIEHGFSLLNEHGKLQIRFSLINNRLVFELVDNGKGLQVKTPLEQKFGNHQSMATKITNERINLMYDKKVKRVNFSINEMKDSLNTILGTKVEFSIPYISQY